MTCLLSNATLDPHIKSNLKSFARAPSSSKCTFSLGSNRYAHTRPPVEIVAHPISSSIKGVCHRRLSSSSSSRCAKIIPLAAQKYNAGGTSKSNDISISTARSGKLTDVLICLAAAGFSTGTFLDGIHGRVNLLIYDKLPLEIGGLHTSAFVPVLLAVFYVSLGSLVLFMDQRMWNSDKTTRYSVQHSSLSKMAVSFGALAAMLELSSYLYANEYSSSAICLALAACAAVNYLVFDGTKQGLGLALLCAVAAPASELVLMANFELWHYPHGELYTAIAGGIPKWVPFCYFFYVPAVSNLARYLWKTM